MTTLNINKKSGRSKNKTEILELKRLKHCLINMLEDLGEKYIDIE